MRGFPIFAGIARQNWRPIWRPFWPEAAGSVPIGTNRRHAARSGRFRRDVGPLGLVFASLGSMVGSGWLFGALHASSSTTMTVVSTVSSARSLDQRRSNASRSMWSGAVKAAMCAATGSAHCSNSTGRSSCRTSRNISPIQAESCRSQSMVGWVELNQCASIRRPRAEGGRPGGCRSATAATTGKSVRSRRRLSSI